MEAGAGLLARMQWETRYPQHDVLDNTVLTLISRYIKGPKVRTGNVHIQTFTLDSWLHWFLKCLLLSNYKSGVLEYLKENMVHSLGSGVGWLKFCGWFQIIYCNQAPVRRWQNALSPAFLAGKFSGQRSECLVQLQWHFGREDGGRRGGGRRGTVPPPDVWHPLACSGRLSLLHLVPARTV